MIGGDLINGLVETRFVVEFIIRGSVVNILIQDTGLSYGDAIKRDMLLIVNWSKFYNQPRTN